MIVNFRTRKISQDIRKRDAVVTKYFFEIK
jgi:hypothetical protein